MVKVRDLGSRDCEFESRSPYILALNSVVEYHTFNVRGLGSSPRGRTIEPTHFLLFVFNRLSFLLIFVLPVRP